MPPNGTAPKIPKIRSGWPLAGLLLLIAMTLYGWSYNQWRQQKIWIHIDSMTQGSEGLIFENGEQVYPDPKRTFYAPARIIFEVYLRFKKSKTRTGTGRIAPIEPADQAEPMLGGFFS